MARLIICDRCGERIENQDDVGYVCLNWRDIKTGDSVGYTKDVEGWDICNDCMKQIEGFVRMKPAPAVPKVNPVLVNKFHERNDAAIEKLIEQQEQPEKPKATIKKPMPARITLEQIEQIKKMVATGTSVNAIAEFVGVSAPTVRKYKKEIEEAAGENESEHAGDRDQDL